MSSCDHFTQNAWRPDLCSTCQRAKSEHEGAAGPRSSWRRRSEPNPNNAITGVRISALASKFQGREARSGSIPEDDLQRARTLDRKYTKSKPGEKKLNASRSTELLDSTSSAALSLAETSAPVSTFPAPGPTSQIKSSSSVVKNQVTVLSKETAGAASTTSASGAVKYIASEGNKIITTQPLPSSKLKTSPTINNQTTSKKITVQPQNNVDSTASAPATKTATVVSRHTPAAKAADKSATSSSSSAATSSKPVKSDPSFTSSVLKSGKSEENGLVKSRQPKTKQRKVSIPDAEPEVIGNDGGLDNLYPEEEVTAGSEDTDNIYLSLTDEEKQFALLALGNTVWNSDTRNLQVETEATKRACREFEDIAGNELWAKERFQSLVDCDAIKRGHVFGTFPKISGAKQSKAPNENLKFKSELGRGGGQSESLRSVRMADDSGEIGKKKGMTLNNGQTRTAGSSNLERLKSSGTSGISGNSSMTSLNSDGDWKGNYGSSSGSGDSGVEMGPGCGAGGDSKDRLYPDDMRDNLYESPDDVIAGKSSLDNSSNPQVKSRIASTDGKSGSNKISNQKDGLSLAQSSSLESDDVRSFELSLNDSSTLDSFQAISLLNDVLRDYGDFNESSTDDADYKETKKDSLKGKKSSDFEARMASVAATLDLTKQQRVKRQAPRPPVSPPPEPNLAQAISPKKVTNQPEPVFKMVTVGKSIVTLPPQQDIPKEARPSQAPLGLEDFVLAGDGNDSVNNKTNGDSKGKKGITSFFRNILRRGKESSESFESMNPDVQLVAKLERKDSSSTPPGGGSLDNPEEDLSSSVDKKLGPKLLQPSGFLVIPPGSQNSPQHKGDTTPGSTTGSMFSKSSSFSSKPPQSSDSDIHQSSITTTASCSSAAASGTTTPVSASPPTQRKKGLASPKMMLKKATAKFSPPASRHPSKVVEKDIVDALSNVPKPYLAPKPSVPPPTKPPTTTATPSFSASSPQVTTAQSVGKEVVAKEKDVTTAPNVVKRRPKSPKRMAPPVPPSRTSVASAKPGPTTDPKNQDLARELEWRLSKATTDQSGTGTLTRSENRESTRRSMPVPPSPPGDRKDRPPGGQSPPISPIRETENSLPSSPSSPTSTSFDFVTTEWSGGSTSTIEEELPKFTEKIELPTVANPGRKGFLGKLGGNRKNRAPQPPSVKRAKSITESSTLPRGDKKSKKINVADISGPVLVTDITNVRVLENRRNTISLGDEPAFHTVTIPTGTHGPATSNASVDKSGFDEFDFPVLSPLGSLENLYESILPKPEGNMFHYYDPPTSPKVLCPNIPADGYLEPVPPLSTTGVAPPLTAGSAAAGLLSTSITTNPSKSPLKAKGSLSKYDRSTPGFTTKESSSSGHSTSTSSSEANSAENSGNSLPDQSSSNGLGPNFIEPEMTEQRKILLASQPIYEEIPNGNNEEEEVDTNAEQKAQDARFKKSAGLKEGLARKPSNSEAISNMQKVMLPGMGSGGELTKSQIAHAWLQQPHTVVPQPPQVPPPTPASSSSSSASSSLTASVIGVLPSSPSHVTPKHNQAPTTLQLSSMSGSQMSVSSIMTTSLTSSMLPPPPPPPDHLPAPPPTASRSVSRETVSSESDTQSNCSTLSRPRPAPRRKPKRPDTGGSDQYVSMNRPNAQVSLHEEKLRDVFTKITSITFHALQDIYAQCEKILSSDRLDIPNPNSLKWADFDIYGQPLHASGRCIVYNAKFKMNSSACQVMVLHSRPATERCITSHPSLLRPSAVFADTIPFSFLTPDFIKTSQLLQNSVYDSSQARCFIAVGAFDIVESLDSHLALLRETLALDPNAYLNVILTAALQLLSAMSHCLDQGFSVTETDYNDVFLITRTDLRGKVVAFLPHQRSLDVPQGEAMCNFLDRLLTDAMPRREDDDDDDLDGDDSDDDDEGGGEKIISSPRKVVVKLRSLLEARKVECLGHVRTAVEYLLWGPATSELPLSPVGTAPKPAVGVAGAGGGGGASREQELYVWLEKERVLTVGRLARNVSGLGAGLSLEEFYTLKFLLKSSAACLAESLRRLAR